MNEVVKAGEVFKLAEVVPYQDGKIVNMDVVHNENIKYSILIGSPNLCAVRIGEFFGILEYVWEWPSEKYPDNYRIQAPKELIKEEYYSRFLKGLWVVSDKTEEEVALAASIAGKARFEYGEKPDM